MSEAIDAVKRELESARHALRGAQEAYEKADRESRAAQDRAARTYEGRAASERNVGRLEKALALLEGRDNEHRG